jgi:arsenate reductase-like glutaredoxin family protein
LQREDAAALLAKAKTMVVSKGKKVTEFAGGSKASEEALDAMLGSTGNLRAPTAVIGKHIIVGFNEDTYSDALK